MAMTVPPKPDAVRRNARNGPRVLPAGGRKDPAPRWPLERQMPGEDTAWRQLWATPQAAAWEELGWTRTVARYCRVMLAAESDEASAAILAQALALEDRLGLTPKSMRMLMWTIAVDEVAAQRDQVPATNVRKRFKAVG